MNPKASTLLFIAFSLFISSTTAFNITKLLGQYSEFSNFNDYLTQTKLDEEINRRQTITVLAVDNGALPAGKSVDVMKKVMSVHVVLDYYDISKLQKLSNKTALLTTLYQSSGSAKTQQGFLNVTILANGDVVFGSAVEGSALNSKLMKSIAAQPYNISVLQISTPIVTPGLGYDGSSSSSPPAKSPEKSEAPAPSKKSDVEAPAPAPAKKDAKAPEAATPKSSSADAPASSVDSPPPAVAEAPLTDAKVPPVADAVAPPPNSSGTRVGAFGAGLLVMGLVVAF